MSRAAGLASEQLWHLQQQLVHILLVLLTRLRRRSRLFFLGGCLHPDNLGPAFPAQVHDEQQQRHHKIPCGQVQHSLHTLRKFPAFFCRRLGKDRKNSAASRRLRLACARTVAPKSGNSLQPGNSAELPLHSGRHTAREVSLRPDAVETVNALARSGARPERRGRKPADDVSSP